MIDIVESMRKQNYIPEKINNIMYDSTCSHDTQHNYFRMFRCGNKEYYKCKFCGKQIVISLKEVE